MREFLRDLEHRGARLELRGGSFVCRAAPGVLTEQDRARLVAFKPEIIAHLAELAAPIPPTRPRMTWQQELATPEVQAILGSIL